jgi:hypothetical protein
MNYFCNTQPCPTNIFSLPENDFNTLYNTYGVQFTKYNTFSINLTVGYNKYVFPDRLFFYKNSYLVLYQIDALVAINSSGNSANSDLLVYDTPYDYMYSSYQYLDTNSKQAFFIRVITNNVNTINCK